MKTLSKKGFNASLVERPFSRRQGEVEKPSFTKILKIPLLCHRLINNLIFFKPTLAIMFITVGYGAFQVDCLLLWILRLFGVDYVLYMHGKGLKRWAKESFFLMRLITKKTLSASLGGIVLGESLKEDVIDYIPADRIIVLPNGIADVTEGLMETTKRETYEGPTTILYLSNLYPAKGPISFLKMAKKILEEEPKTRFIMAGQAASSKFADCLQHYILNAKINERIYMPGAVYGEEKYKLFKKADIFVFPSYREVFGIVNIEAMQWSLPVVSSGEGAIPDVVEDGINGYIVNPKNIDALTEKVLVLIRNPELRLRMGRCGREKYRKEYTLEAFEYRVEKAIKYFEKLQIQC